MRVFETHLQFDDQPKSLLEFKMNFNWKFSSRLVWLVIVAMMIVAGASCNAQNVDVKSSAGKGNQPSAKQQDRKKVETASFGAGCFWCVEAVFQELDGVISVKSGFMGGKVPNPTYEQVCQGTTGHAEICQIVFDPEKITFKELLEVFWKTHDPTTLNRQGPDSGTQYRSAVFYHSDEQRELATKYKKRLDESEAFPRPIVTEIAKASEFYYAGDYHEDFFSRNPNHGYCRALIQPKVEKFRKAFADKLKKK